ncbi:MAG TPA: chemotaxis-specific protein-glutamate methyltransferase CheB [Planctomycetota bacterium]|jgi:two-component system chemotaxis response regulator CheB
MNERAIRVLVVEDSLTVRRAIVDALAADPELTVVGEATDGRQGIEMCQSLRPDVMTLDIVLPVVSGLSVTEYVMAYCPTPILIVSSARNRGSQFKTLDALAAGALEILEKDAGSDDSRVWEQSLRQMVKRAARIKVITHPRGRLKPSPLSPGVEPRSTTPGPKELVVIGASTGGPGALREILHELPADFPLPILLVLHLSHILAASFAEWLDSESRLRVRYVSGVETLPPRGEGCVLLSPPDRHLVLDGNRLRLTMDPERHFCRPSVDVLFESVAAAKGPRTIACVLTGMGSDGAAGLLAIRRAGGLTLAQDQETSVVYGMPREAALLGAAECILPLPEIAPWLVQSVR